MALSAHTMKTSGRKTKRRLGRGHGSTKGTYAGRGMKGQRSRSGGKGGLQRRGFKAQLQKIPKMRGFNSPHAKPETVTLAMLERAYESGEAVNPRTLGKKGIINKPQNGIKIVAKGELKKSLTVTQCLASKGAIAAVEKAGGTITF